MAETIDLSRAELLGRAEFFAGIDRVALAQLTAHLDSCDLAPGDVLFHQGDEGDALYIVADGVLEVVVAAPDGRGQTVVNTLHQGAFLGEMALITGEPRSATVRAHGPVCVLRLGRDRFLELLSEEPSVARSVISVLSARLRTSNAAYQQRDVAARGTLDGILSQMSEQERRDLLWSSVLPKPTSTALKAIFGDRAEEIRASLEYATASFTEGSDFQWRALRERLDQEVARDEIEDFLGRAGARLADAGLWNAACSVHAQQKDRPLLAATLGKALAGDPAFDYEQAVPWIKRLSQQQMVTEPRVAMLAARQYREQGEVATAQGLLDQAAQAALAAGNAEAATELNGAIGELGHHQGGPPLAGRRAWGHVPLPRGVRITWRPYAIGTVALAVACVVAGGILSRQDPRIGFVLFFVSALALWNSNVFPDFAVGLALVGVWVLSGIAPAHQAVAGFATMDWLFVLAVLGLAVAVARSGLLFRVGLLLVQRSPARLAPQAVALMLTGLLLSPLLPEPRGRAALTAPLAIAVSDAFRLKDREPAAAILGLAAWIGSGPLMFLFLNASPVCLLAWGLMPTEERNRFDWLTWFVTALPFALIVAAGTLVALFLLLKPHMESLPSREGLLLQLALLGPVTNRERAMIGVLVLTVIGWFAAPVPSVHVGTIAVLGLFAAAAIGAFDQQAFREMDWGFLIYYGVALSMRNLSDSLGMAEAAASLLGMAGSGAGSGGAAFLLVHPMVFISIVLVVGFVARFVLESSQAVLLLTLIFFPAATAADVSPWLVGLALLATNNPWVTLKQTPAYQVAFVGTEGRLYTQGQARTAALAFAGVTLGAIVLLGPYWRWVGLL